MRDQRLSAACCSLKAVSHSTIKYPKIRDSKGTLSLRGILYHRMIYKLNIKEKSLNNKMVAHSTNETL